MAKKTTKKATKKKSLGKRGKAPAKRKVTPQRKAASVQKEKLKTSKKTSTGTRVRAFTAQIYTYIVDYVPSSCTTYVLGQEVQKSFEPPPPAEITITQRGSPCNGTHMSLMT